MPDKLELMDAVLLQLRPTYHAVYRAVERNLAETGVTAPMRGLLGALAAGGGKTVPHLARELQIPRQFALKLARELEALGLVGRQTNPGHRTSDLIVLTPAGQALTARIHASERKAVAPLVRRLTADQLTAALAVLTGLQSHFVEPTDAG